MWYSGGIFIVFWRSIHCQRRRQFWQGKPPFAKKIVVMSGGDCSLGSAPATKLFLTTNKSTLLQIQLLQLARTLTWQVIGRTCIRYTTSTFRLLETSLWCTLKAESAIYKQGWCQYVTLWLCSWVVRKCKSTDKIFSTKCHRSTLMSYQITLPVYWSSYYWISGASLVTLPPICFTSGRINFTAGVSVSIFKGSAFFQLLFYVCIAIPSKVNSVYYKIYELF